MKFFRFFKLIFSFSYDFICQSKENISIEKYVRIQKKFNFDLNDYILSNILKLNDNENQNSHQLLIDVVNYFLINHLDDRIKIYRTTRYFGKSSFIYISQLLIIKYSFIILLKGISNSINTFHLKNFRNSFQSNILCFGFPEHAFSYQDQSKRPSSFMEFLILNDIIKEKDGIISIDEYARPSRSKKTKNKLTFVKNDRFIIKKTRSFKKLFKLFNSLSDSYKELKNKFGLNNLFIYSFYFEKFSKSILLNDLFTNFKKNNIKIRDNYAMSLYDIGSLKYDTNELIINYFNYSQNCFIPPSSKIYNDIFGKKKENEITPHLDEFTINIFSMYHHGQTNLSYHIHYINQVIKKIKTLYGLRLKTSTPNYDLIKSNLGYESVFEIKLDSKRLNFILFDLPLESFEHTLKRQLCGDYFATNSFIFEAYNEIIEIVKKFKIKLYIKPKYSITNTNSKKTYETFTDILSINKIDFEMINPYDKIEVKDVKFDFSINLPYTSTYHTINHITKNNVYYIPKAFYSYFKGISKDVIDYKKLNSLLNSKIL